ncbi:TPA: DNA-directed RNA polymerase subunit K [Candidatus Woesearchaeota archaeon]|nr:DNA-directed RNA polymerase subunit K [Candidatus Woesearchaeota archaeon]
MAKHYTTEDVKDYTKYEKTRMIGSRALQLSMGAPFLVSFTPEELKAIHYDTIEIALKEYNQGVLPITVRRPTMGKKSA